MAKVIEEAAEYSIIEIMKLRSTIFSFLSRGHKREVDELFLKSLEKMMQVFEKLTLGLENENLMSCLRDFNSFIETICNKSKLIEDLERQYVTLFLGLGTEKEIAHSSPHESVYLSSQGQVMEEQYDDVVEFFNKLQIGLRSDFKEHEDHISAELSFMSKLCDILELNLRNNEEGELLDNLNIQKDFMKVHILNWVPMLCNDLRKAAKDGFYHYFADLTMAYLYIDFEFIESLLEVFEENNKANA